MPHVPVPFRSAHRRFSLALIYLLHSICVIVFYPSICFHFALDNSRNLSSISLSLSFEICVQPSNTSENFLAARVALGLSATESAKDEKSRSSDGRQQSTVSRRLSHSVRTTLLQH